MNENPLISVIVPCYNVAAYLDKCIQSIINQTYKNLEIILVDDGSTDESGAIIDRYANQDVRILPVHQMNKGVSAARNAGLDVCKGDFITFVDGDDYILPEAYEEMLKPFSEVGGDKVAIVAVGRKVIQDGKTVGESKCSTKRLLGGEQLWREHLRINGNNTITFSLCTKLFCAGIFDSIRFVEGIRCEDVEISIRILASFSNDMVICELPEAYYCYNYNPHSFTKKGISLERLEALESSVPSDDLIKTVSDSYRKFLYAFSMKQYMNAWQFIDASDKEKNFMYKRVEYKQKINELYKKIKNTDIVGFENRVIIYCINLHAYKTIYMMVKFLKRRKI